MSFANKYNKGRKFSFDTTGLGYVSMHDLYNMNGADKVYTLRGIYINRKSMYGDTPVFACSEGLVNAPKHLLDTVSEILESAEDIQAINDGRVGFKVYTYTNEKINKACYGISFVDIDTNPF